MKPLPLRPRILGALELAPMTTATLTRVLSANSASVQHYVDELRGMRLIAPVRTQHRRTGAPRNVWGIVHAPVCIQTGKKGQPPGIVKGSGGITDMLATVVEVWRNKPRERAMADAEQTGEPLPEKYEPDGASGAGTLLLVHKQNATGEEPAVMLPFSQHVVGVA